MLKGGVKRIDTEKKQALLSIWLSLRPSDKNGLLSFINGECFFSSKKVSANSSIQFNIKDITSSYNYLVSSLPFMRLFTIPFLSQN